MSGLWGWVHDSLRDFQQAAQQGDADRGRLVSVFNEVIRAPSTLLRREPRVAFTRLSEARATAERIGESGWVLLLDKYRMDALRQQGRLREACDLGMRMAVAARRPPFTQYPQRFCLTIEGVIRLFLLIDPEGYADQIQEAFDYLVVEVPSDLDCTQCLLGARSHFARFREQFAEARHYDLRILEQVQGRAYGEALVYLDLCENAIQENDWVPIQGWAVAGEEAARRSQQDLITAAFLAWQAAVARRSGDERSAHTLYRAAAQISAAGDIDTPGLHSTAVCRYYEAGGELERALGIREHQVARLAGQGLTYLECQYRLELCRLLAQMGRPYAAELTTLRTLAGQLIHPQSFLHRLADLET